MKKSLYLIIGVLFVLLAAVLLIGCNRDSETANTVAVSSLTTQMLTSSEIVTTDPKSETSVISTVIPTTEKVTTEKVTIEIVTTVVPTTLLQTTEAVITTTLTAKAITTNTPTTSVITTKPVTTVVVTTPEVKPLQTDLPTKLPDGNAFSVKVRVGLDLSADYTVSGNSSANVSFSASGAAKGNAVHFGVASNGTRGEIRLTLSDPVDIGGAGGVLFYVDFSATRPQTSNGPCATVTLNANDYRSNRADVQAPAYYYLYGEWHETGCAVKDRMQLPVGFSGWVYITAAAYQDTSSGAAITDSNGNFSPMSVSSFNLYTDQYDFSYSGTEIVFDEIMFVKKELCKTHTPVNLPAREADCMHTGMTAGIICAVCNTILDEQTPIPRTAHTPKNLPAVTPDCENTGLTAGSVCSTCGIILARQTVLDKTEHSFDNGKCCVCGIDEPIGFTIGGIPLNDFVIVYAADAEDEEGTELASMLNAIIWEYHRVRLDVIPDTEAVHQHEIRIGKARHSSALPDTFDYDVQFADGNLIVRGGGCWAMYHALSLVEADYFANNVSVSAEFYLTGNIYGKQIFERTDVSNLRVLDNNIWQNDSDSIPSAWKKLGADPTDKCRSRGLAEVVYAYMPDIVSLQEYSPHMDKYLRPLLEEYGYCLSYNPQGSSDFTPIFFNMKTVELLTSVYHSYQPTTYNNGNTKSYNAGVFRLKSNGRVFGIISTHLWYKTEKDFKGSNAARCDQVRTIIAEVEKLSVQYDCPFFVMGDMNSAIGSDPMQIFVNSGFVHAHDTAVLKTDDTLGAHDCDSSKFSRASTRTTDARVDGPIDQFFSYNLSQKDKILVFDRVDPYFFICLSDHYPVVVDLYLSE